MILCGLFACAVASFAPPSLAWENELTNEWSREIGAPSDSSPAIGADGTIYFGAFDGRLWALNPNGSKKWVFVTGHGGIMGIEIKSSPAVAADGTIYFGCRDRKLYALKPDGRKKWEFKTGGWVDSSPALGTDGTVFFGSWDTNVYAVSPDGRKKWAFATAGVVASSPAVGREGTIWIGSNDRNLYALNPDGTERWHFATGGQIISSPALGADETAVVTSLDGFLYAVDRGGKMKWKLHTGGITESSPVIGSDGTVYVGVNREVWAVTPEGKKLWFGKPDGVAKGPPVALADQWLCVITDYGLLMGWEPGPRMKWCLPVSAYGCASPAVGANGMVYISGGGLRFFGVKTGSVLASSSWPKFRGNPRNTGNLADSPGPSGAR